MASTIWEHLDPTKPVSIIIIIIINTIVILIFKTPLPVQVYMFVIMIIGQKNTTISVIYCRTTRGSRSLQSMFIAVLLSLKNWKRHQGWETLIVVITHSQLHHSCQKGHPGSITQCDSDKAYPHFYHHCFLLHLNCMFDIRAQCSSQPTRRSNSSLETKWTKLSLPIWRGEIVGHCVVNKFITIVASKSLSQ